MNDTNIHTQTHISKSYSLGLKRFVFQFQFAFSNRDQYRDFVRFWKASYASLSTAIRDQKRTVSATMRGHEYAGTHQARLLELRAQATAQLEMRHAAKVESNRQYLAAKQMMT